MDDCIKSEEIPLTCSWDIVFERTGQTDKQKPKSSEHSCLKQTELSWEQDRIYFHVSSSVQPEEMRCSGTSPVGALHPVQGLLERFEAGPGCAGREHGNKETHVIAVGRVTNPEHKVTSFRLFKEQGLYSFTTLHPFPVLSTGYGVAEAFVSVPHTSQTPPPAAQLQASSQMVAGGWEAAPQPPCFRPGQSGGNARRHERAKKMQKTMKWQKRHKMTESLNLGPRC